MSAIDPELLSRYLKDGLGSNERATVEAWMLEHGITRDFLQKVIHPSDELRIMMQLDPAADWNEIQTKVHHHRSQRLYWKVAASIILAAGIGWAFFFLRSAITTPSYVTIVNNEGQVKEVQLPDSSIVFIKPGASIDYAEDFLHARDLRLDGEAFFDVRRDSLHPFVIAAQSCQIQVLGTSFLVQADSAFVDVLVRSGKVSFAAPNAPKMILEKTERGYYNASTGEVEESRDENDNNFSPYTQVLEFNDTPLDRVVADLQRHFSMKFRLKPNYHGVIPRFTSRFERPTLTDVLEEMKLVLSINYTIENDLVTIIIK